MFFDGLYNYSNILLIMVIELSARHEAILIATS